uniref:PUM-HD domain-containing protein n=1 Tax=Noctiluca scintillans TaxID=2966 RepID=A0A7S1B1B7_NOCSC|mmetsp:Transcript_7898/g.21759  ORF Transcript_7898/g.21759 Transcript_7898/m.21759 type:complete len:217 (+) Transcript_7898:64-714(+)
MNVKNVVLRMERLSQEDQNLESAVKSSRRVSFSDQHGGQLVEIRLFELSVAEQIVKASPQVPEKLSEFLLEEFDIAERWSQTFDCIRGALVALAMSENGSEVVLKSLVSASDVELRSMTSELEEHVLDLAYCASGCEILHFYIEVLAPSKAEFIVSALCGHAGLVAENPFGVELLCSMLQFMPPSLLPTIADEVPTHILEMCTNNNTFSVPTPCQS